MKKIKALCLAFLMFCALLLAGCGGTNTNPAPAPKPQAEKPEVTAEKILKYTSYQQWQQLYDYLHPDMQSKITREEFIAERSKSGDGLSIV